MSTTTSDLFSETEEVDGYWTEWSPGRPTKYSNKFPKLLIEHMKGGNSFESFGAVVNVDVTTLYRWERAHEDFRHAKGVARQHARLSFENLGKAGMTGQIKQVKSETIVTRTVGKGDKAVTTTTKKTEFSHFWDGGTYKFLAKNITNMKDTIEFSDSDFVEKMKLNGKPIGGQSE